MKRDVVYRYFCSVCGKMELSASDKFPLGWSIYKLTEVAFLQSHTEKLLICTKCKPSPGDGWYKHILKFFKIGE